MAGKISGYSGHIPGANVGEFIGKPSNAFQRPVTARAGYPAGYPAGGSATPSEASFSRGQDRGIRRANSAGSVASSRSSRTSGKLKQTVTSDSQYHRLGRPVLGYSGHRPGKPVGSSQADGVSYGLERQAQEATGQQRIHSDIEGYSGFVPAAKRREANSRETYRGVVPILDGSLIERQRPSSAPGQEAKLDPLTAYRSGSNTGYTGHVPKRHSQAFVGKQVRAHSVPADPTRMPRAGQYSAENHMFPDVRVGERDQTTRSMQFVRREMPEWQK